MYELCYSTRILGIEQEVRAYEKLRLSGLAVRTQLPFAMSKLSKLSAPA